MGRFGYGSAVLVSFLAGTAVSFFTLPIWIAFAINLAKDGNRSDWLGFAGAIVGAFATLAAAGVALFAAYKTLKPVKDQLNQLVKQNDHMLYDRLRKRSVDLNAETILINQVVSGCEIVERRLTHLLGSHSAIPNGVNEFQTAVDRLESVVARLQERRGDIWGDVQTQNVRAEFIDASLEACSIAMQMVIAARGTVHLIKLTIKPETNGWNGKRDVVRQLGVRLALLIKFEFSKVRKETAAVEIRLLGREGIFHKP